MGRVGPTIIELPGVMMLFFKRPIYFEKITKAFRLSQVVSVLGPRGVGKSSLARHWVREQVSDLGKIRWISISSFSTLAEHIGSQTETSIEQSLDHFSQAWDRYSYIVWDDLHHLPQKQQSLLVSYLKSVLSGPRHILISDENASFFQLETPVVMVDPLTVSELDSYIRDFLQIDQLSLLAIENIWTNTGGLPLLVNLWSQNQGTILFEESHREFPAFMGEALLSIFNRTEIRKLAFVYFLRKVPIEAMRALESLYSKFFLTKDLNTYSLHSYLVPIIERSISDDIKAEAAEDAVTFLRGFPSYDAFLIWWIGLSTKNWVLCYKEVLHFELFKLESLIKKDLSMIYSNLILLLPVSQVDFDDPFFRHCRLLLQAGILLGERVDSLNQLYRYQDQLLDESIPLTNERSNLIYEIVYWSQRTGNDSRGKVFFNFIYNRAEGSLKYLLQIEMAFPYISTDPVRATAILQRVKDALPKQLLQSSEQGTSLLKVKAHTLFELAKLKSQLALREEALLLYEEAEKNYSMIGLTYYSLFCRINQIFEFLNELKLDVAQVLCKQILPLLAKYDYRYLQSLNLLAQSVIFQEHMQLGQALECINQALRILPEGAPEKATQDILHRKGLILFAMGFTQDAIKIEFGKSEYSNRSYLQCLLTDQILDDLSDVPENEVQDRGTTDLDSLRIQMLYSGIEIDPVSNEKLERTSWGRWCLLEKKLKNALAHFSKPTEELQTIVSSMRSIVDVVDDMIPEKIGLDILAWQIEHPTFALRKIHNDKLLKLEERLAHSPFNEIAKEPWYAILEVLKGFESLEENPHWKRSRFLDRARWGNWLLPISESLFQQYVILTAVGSVTARGWSEETINEYPLVVIEHIGAVYYQQKELLEFHRKSILRQILSNLLESYPAAMTKSQLAQVIWGERYSSLLHDPRIYTSIQRLRQLIDSRCIESWNGGYRWTSGIAFALIKNAQLRASASSKNQVLILQALANYAKSGIAWATRADIEEATQSSESTVKRELSKLLNDGKIVKRGSGAKVTYSLKRW